MAAQMVPRKTAGRNSAASPAPSPMRAKAAQLIKLRGLGVHFSTVLAGEVYYRTFPNRRGVGQCLGLAPSPFHSDAKRARPWDRQGGRQAGATKR